VYIDGRLAATMPPVDFNTSGADAASFEVDGGDPLQLGRGAIYLCGRADNAPDRHFTGAVTHLALYNDILTPLEIRMLFTQARRAALGRPTLCIGTHACLGSTMAAAKVRNR